MSDTNNFMDGALPSLPNASNVTKRLMSLQMDAVMVVKRHELPPSYPGLKSLTGRISRQYKMYFVVLELEDNSGWKVIRVVDLVTSKQFFTFGVKSKHMENSIPEKNNNFSDANLAQMIDAKIGFANRDIADLDPRGVTVEILDQLEEDNDDFKDLPSDAELQGDWSDAVDAKEAARNLLESKIGNVRTMAQNVFGNGSTKYKSFKFLGMISVPDNDLVRVGKIVWKRATKFKAELLSEGCTDPFLLALKGLIDDLDDKIDAAEMADSDRHEGTATRTTTGNDLYTRTAKICNTAKDVYRETDPTKHNEYVIYHTSAGAPHTVTTSFSVNPMSGTVLVNIPYRANRHFTFHNAVPIPLEVFISNDGINPVGTVKTVMGLNNLSTVCIDLHTLGDYIVVRNNNPGVIGTGTFTYEE